MNFKKLLKSKTVWGGIFTAASVVLTAPAVTPEVIVQAGGILLGVFGLRDAISKNGTGN